MWPCTLARVFWPCTLAAQTGSCPLHPRAARVSDQQSGPWTGAGQQGPTWPSGYAKSYAVRRLGGAATVAALCCSPRNLIFHGKQVHPSCMSPSSSPRGGRRTAALPPPSGLCCPSMVQHGPCRWEQVASDGGPTVLGQSCSTSIFLFSLQLQPGVSSWRASTWRQGERNARQAGGSTVRQPAAMADLLLLFDSGW